MRLLEEILEESVNDTPYGRFIIQDLTEKNFAYPKDRLHEIIGITQAYIRINEDASQEALETPISTRIQIAKKALEAVEEVRRKEMESDNN